MKKISQNGEWWIIDGKAIFADSNVGDMGHEAYVLERVRGDIASTMDWYREIDRSWDDIKILIFKQLVERGEIDENYVKKLIKKYGEDFADKIPYSPEIFDYVAINQFNIPKKKLDIADGSGDIRAYGMSELGWKRMAGLNIETQTLTENDLKDICDGIDEAYGEEITDESEFNIEVRGSRKWITGIPLSVMRNGVSEVLKYRNVLAKNWYSISKVVKMGQRFDELEDWETFKREFASNYDEEPTQKNMREYYKGNQYFSIGQNDDLHKTSYCWVWRYDEIEKKIGGTHSSNFGSDARDEWRGWYDPSQELVSVVIPPRVSQRTKHTRVVNINMVPPELVKDLRNEFGDKFKIKVF